MVGLRLTALIVSKPFTGIQGGALTLIFGFTLTVTVLGGDIHPLPSLAIIV